jgi:putative hydrolase of HD superfamily
MTATVHDIPALADTVTVLSGYALAFGRIDRTACWHPDGRPESDTDHTVMLAWIAPALADLLYPDLDTNLVCTFASLHDAVEVFAGDTPTLRIDAAGRTAKAERERQAALRWWAEFQGSLPWIGEMICRYERQEEPEARFVRAADKCCPALTHMSNDCADIADFGLTAGEIEGNRTARRAEMAAYAGEFPAILDLRDELSRRLAAMLRTRQERACL